MSSVNNKQNSSLMGLQPVDNSPFKKASSPWLVWLTLIFVAMASLLPWRQWQPVPDVLFLLLIFWCFHEPTKIGLVTVFIFGLLMDVHDSSLLGQHALCYVIGAYGVLLLHRRLQHFNPVVQMVHILPVILFASMVSGLLSAWLNGSWIGWDWLWSALITAVLWPFLDMLIFLHQRRSVTDDVGSV